MATYLEKLVITNKIKNITYYDAIIDFQKLQQYEYNGKKSPVGNRCTDFFTFNERLNTIGNKKINFWEFYNNIDFYRQKPYINNFIINNEHAYPHIKLLFNTFKLYYGNIGSFNSSTTAGIIDEFKPKHVIDCFAGYGGRLIGCISRDTAYTGFDTNLNINYNSIIGMLLPYTNTKENKYQVFNTPAERVDYSGYSYDMVLTSPPYYDIEVYAYCEKKTKREWDALYETVFKNTYQHLQDGGVFAINVNQEIYERVLVKLFGEAIDKVLYTGSNSRTYKEYIYLWVK